MAEIKILYDFYKQALASGGRARALNMLGGGLTTTQILLFSFHNAQQGKFAIINAAFMLTSLATGLRSKHVADWLARHRALSPNDNYTHLIEDYASSVRMRGVAGFFSGAGAACAAHQSMAWYQYKENLDWKVVLVGAGCVAVGMGFSRVAKILCDKHEAMSNDPDHFKTRISLSHNNPPSPS